MEKMIKTTLWLALIFFSSARTQLVYIRDVINRTRYDYTLFSNNAVIRKLNVKMATALMQRETAEELGAEQLTAQIQALEKQIRWLSHSGTNIAAHHRTPVNIFLSPGNKIELENKYFADSQALDAIAPQMRSYTSNESLGSSESFEMSYSKSEEINYDVITDIWITWKKNTSNITVKALQPLRRSWKMLQHIDLSRLEANDNQPEFDISVDFSNQTSPVKLVYNKEYINKKKLRKHMAKTKIWLENEYKRTFKSYNRAKKYKRMRELIKQRSLPAINEEFVKQKPQRSQSLSSLRPETKKRMPRRCKSLSSKNKPTRLRQRRRSYHDLETYPKDTN